MKFITYVSLKNHVCLVVGGIWAPILRNLYAHGSCWRSDIPEEPTIFRVFRYQRGDTCLEFFDFVKNSINWLLWVECCSFNLILFVAQLLIGETTTMCLSKVDDGCILLWIISMFELRSESIYAEGIGSIIWLRRHCSNIFHSLLSHTASSCADFLRNIFLWKAWSRGCKRSL